MNPSLLDVWSSLNKHSAVSCPFTEGPCGLASKPTCFAHPKPPSQLRHLLCDRLARGSKSVCTSNAFTTVRWSLFVSFANSFLLASAIFSFPFRTEKGNMTPCTTQQRRKYLAPGHNPCVALPHQWNDKRVLEAEAGSDGEYRV